MAISKPFAYNPSTSFSIGSGFNNTALTIAIQSDGKILAGGNFTEFSGISQNSLIRLNSNGSKDTSFNIGSGFDSGVGYNSIAIQSDGKILVGGYFTTFSGASQNYLIRLNSDGSKDSTFNIGSGFNGGVVAIAIQSDGKILAGGEFTTFTGSTQNRLIRLNSDGSKDSTFNIGSGFNMGFFDIELQSDGKILVGGYYTQFTGSSQSYLIRLNSDGTKDTSFNIGSGFNVGSQSYVQKIKVDSNGKILVGGAFTSYSGSSQNRLIRLNSDGTKDTSFNIGNGFNYSGFFEYPDVFAIAIQSDGKIVVGGNFPQFTGSTQNRIIRLNSNGSKDTTFNIGTGFDTNVWSIEIDSNQNILAVGSFTTYSGSSQNYLTKLNSNGSIFSGGAAPAISGTTQYGDLVVGNIQTEYSLNYGGIKWWGGPNEELGYVIGNARPGGQPAPAGAGGPAYVGFFRSTLLTDNSFLSLANYIGAQNSQPPFVTTSAAVTWLNANGYYTSYVV